MVSNLIALVKELKKRPPFLMAIWVADRRDLLDKIYHLIEESPSTGEISAATRVPVIEYYSKYFDPNKDLIANRPSINLAKLRDEHPGMRVWPWFVQYPGVYIEMSDGQWLVLKIPESQQA